MRDQVSSLEKKGLSSICVEGALTSDNDMANIATGRKNYALWLLFCTVYCFGPKYFLTSHACLPYNLYVAGKYQVVFISPELLLTEETWRDMLQSPIYKQHLVGFIIDEAHCIIKW